MAKKLYDLAVATSKYTTRDGKEKSTWENVGSLLENDKGGKYIMLKATFNPAGLERRQGSDSVVISLFAPKDKDNSSDSSPQRSSATGQAQNQEDFHFSNFEDVPF